MSSLVLNLTEFYMLLLVNQHFTPKRPGCCGSEGRVNYTPIRGSVICITAPPICKILIPNWCLKHPSDHECV